MTGGILYDTDDSLPQRARIPSALLRFSRRETATAAFYIRPLLSCPFRQTVMLCIRYLRLRIQ